MSIFRKRQSLPADSFPIGEGPLLVSLIKHRAVIVLLFLLLTGIAFLWISTRPDIGPEGKFFELLGTVLVPAALVTFLFELFLRASLLREMRSEMALSLRKELGAWREIEQTGFVRVHGRFPLEHVTSNIEKAETNIRILANWLPDPIQLERSLKTALQAGRTVQVILMDPESPQARARGEDLGFSDTGAVPKEIRSSIAELARFAEKEPSIQKLELYLHRRTPSHLLFAWDTTVVVGVYLIGVHSLQGPFLEFSVESAGIGHELIANFDRLLRCSKPLPFVPRA